MRKTVRLYMEELKYYNKFPPSHVAVSNVWTITTFKNRIIFA